MKNIKRDELNIKTLHEILGIDDPKELPEIFQAIYYNDYELLKKLLDENDNEAFDDLAEGDDPSATRSARLHANGISVKHVGLI